MVYTPKSNFQNHPFHLVSPSPWPLYTSISLFILTTSTVLFMHGFNLFEYLIFISIINVIYSMGLWFRDIISEGTKILSSFLFIVKAISTEVIKKIISNIDNNKFNLSKDQFGYYLAGLLEGDGHISLPFKGNTTLNRVLNPRIVFTSHKNNIELYVYIQKMLGGVGCFQLVNNNTIRYIIGDIKGITLFINTVHNKLRTPKNESFNKLIGFMNKKYNLIIPLSNLDKSNFSENSWFTGFTEADGYFGVKIVDFKPKSDTRKRSVSNSVSLKFRLDQRFIDKVTSLSMFNIMEKLSIFLSCKLSTYKTPQGQRAGGLDNNKVLSLNVTSIGNIKFIIDYFNKFPLLGIKYKDFKDWEIIYGMIISKEHLTEDGRSKIKLIQFNMNNRRK
jgi:Cytochrome c oxidase subunit III/LAGLIDADG endonuclease